MALTTDELARFAAQARELMNDSGAHWMQGEYRESDFDTGEWRYCSIGAVRKAVFGEIESTDIDNLNYQSVVDALAQAVREQYGDWYHDPTNETCVIDFNDHQGTEWADVERVFRRAEEILSLETQPA